jgi:D-arginine dehydrogenase
VRELTRVPDGWLVRAGAETWQAPIVVNAAGAWADQIARMAGIDPVGLVPRRRTLFSFDPPPGTDSDPWPMVTTHPEVVYFKPDAGRLVVCPTDTEPSPPCDAQPEEMDLALGAARVEEWTRMKVQRMQARWSGLRTFAPDESPVIGFDPDAEGFFWLAGLAGYGIKTSPACAVAAASLVERGRFAAELADLDLEEAELSPARLRRFH